MTSLNRAGWARTTAMSAAQSPPSATAIAKSSSTFAGVMNRPPHPPGASAVDSALSSPEHRIVCVNSSPPEDDTNNLRAGSTTTTGTELRFTYRVPFPCRTWTVDKPKFSSRTGTSVHYETRVSRDIRNCPLAVMKTARWWPRDLPARGHRSGPFV